MVLKDNQIYISPPYSWKSLGGKWNFIGGSCDPQTLCDAQKIHLESRLKLWTQKMQRTKNRFKREMYRKRAEAARVDLASLLLSK